VTLRLPKRSAKGFDRHVADVADVHDDVPHGPESPRPPRSSPAVAVCSPTPKLSPETVKEPYPLWGAFRPTADAAAASKLKTGLPVPTVDATVNTPLLNKSPRAFDKHANVVTDVHDDVKQTPRSLMPPRSSPAVMVSSLSPKLRPETVTDAYPLWGAFKWTYESTEGS